MPSTQHTHFTVETIDNMYFNNGLSWQKIANVCGCKDKSCVYQWRKRQKKKKVNTSTYDSGHLPKEAKSLAKSSQRRPKILDWSWTHWYHEILEINLLPHQLEDLHIIESKPRSVINDPRRHGKTFVVEFGFIIRKLCESYLTKLDEPIIFSSGVKAVVDLMGYAVKSELEDNPKIWKYYGQDILDLEAKNTTTIFSVKGRIDKKMHSFMSIAAGAKFRGTGCRWFLGDDLIDVFSEVEFKKLTPKIMTWIEAKITPIAKGGNITIIGTRYDLDDIYYRLSKKSTWFITSRKAVLKFGSYTIPEGIGPGELMPHNIIIEGEWQLLAASLFTALEVDPEATPEQNLAYLIIDLGQRMFSREMQNNPLALNPKINWEWFKIVEALPTKTEAMKWVCFTDVASGESSEADHNCMSLMGYWNHAYYLVDLLVFQKSAHQKYTTIMNQIESWSKMLNKNIELRIETVMNQRETFQFVRDNLKGVKVIGFEQKGRGEKEFRILNNIGESAEVGKINILKSCRFVQDFEREVSGFPDFEHDDILDSVDSSYYILRKNERSFSYKM